MDTYSCDMKNTQIIGFYITIFLFSSRVKKTGLFGEQWSTIDIREVPVKYQEANAFPI